jgi:succinate dehydrogenase / fumarate reductase, membrane anchor subunit
MESCLMAVGRTIWTEQDAAQERRRHPSAARGGAPMTGRERFWWYFMRISGLLLVVLALGHMLIMHVLVQLSGHEINYAFITSRWGTPFWRIYDLLLLLLALVHGVNGARIIIGDYVQQRTLRAGLIGLLVVVTVIWIIAGMIVIIAFNPVGAPKVGPFS